MVKTKLDHLDSLVVSANVINEAALEGLHSHPSIALPYLPELQLSEPVDHDSWSPSALPRWQGYTGFRVPRDFSPPFENHRWLLSDEESFDHTPIGMSIYSEDGPRPGDWNIKAQQHNSFLRLLESGDLNRYKFPLWTNPTDPISTAFFCFEGGNAEFVESFMQIDREGSKDLLAGSSANEQDKDILIDGKGLAVRYASGSDSEGLDAMDVLQRCRCYAREMVCPDYI
ncbi:hypothetical protein BDV19DRAFT_209051 [Aspergillus venezuelensis]